MRASPGCYTLRHLRRQPTTSTGRMSTRCPDALHASPGSYSTSSSPISGSRLMTPSSREFRKGVRSRTIMLEMNSTNRQTPRAATSSRRLRGRLRIGDRAVHLAAQAHFRGSFIKDAGISRAFSAGTAPGISGPTSATAIRHGSKLAADSIPPDPSALVSFRRAIAPKRSRSPTSTRGTGTPARDRLWCKSDAQRARFPRQARPAGFPRNGSLLRMAFQPTALERPPKRRTC